MRIMAFDYGTKRIGIAVTDPMQIIATGLDTIHPNQIIDYLKTDKSSDQAFGTLVQTAEKTIERSLVDEF